MSDFKKIECPADRPKPFDLCKLVGKNGKCCVGWRSGANNYEGLYIDRIDSVIAWRLANERSNSSKNGRQKN